MPGSPPSSHSGPYKRVFLEIRLPTFSERISARWSTGMILRSFWTRQVRLVATFLDYRPDTHFSFLDQVESRPCWRLHVRLYSNPGNCVLTITPAGRL